MPALVKSHIKGRIDWLGRVADREASLRSEPLAEAMARFETLEVTADLRLTADRPLSVLVDLIARFRKSNQQLSPKVFKWTETRLKPGQALRLRKALPLRDVTTRRHYPGKQGLAVQVNGVTLAETEFDLRSE